MLGIKDITSCSVMVNSKYPEQQSLIIYPKILLLSPPLTKFQNMKPLFQMGCLFALEYTSYTLKGRSLLMLPLAWNKWSSLFKSSSFFRAQVKSYFSHIPSSGSFLSCRPSLWSSLSSLYGPAYSPLHLLIGMYVSSPPNNGNNNDAL